MLKKWIPAVGGKEFTTYRAPEVPFLRPYFIPFADGEVVTLNFEQG